MPSPEKLQRQDSEQTLCVWWSYMVPFENVAFHFRTCNRKMYVAMCSGI